MIIPAALRRLSGLLVLVVAAAVAFVLLSSGTPAPVAPADGRRGGVGAAPAQAVTPLVDRVLGQLRAGKTTEAQVDNPLAGAPLQVTAARPGVVVPIGRLRIPAIGLDTPVHSGVHAKALLAGPGHWPGTPLPGAPGNSVLSGHRSTETRPFLHLDRLRPGDRLSVRVGSRTVAYAVVRTTIVAERDYVAFVLRQPKARSERLLTLFACHPKTAHYKRIVVQARAVTRR